VTGLSGMARGLPVALALLLAAALLLVPLSSPAWAAGKRVALVIGNDSYRSLPDLGNAVRDARAMAATLSELGFQTVLLTDTDRRSMGRALLDLERSAHGAEAALLFFAGHGIQVDGRNYLVPSDAEILDEGDLTLEAFAAEALVAPLQGSGSDVSILILDACRDNPLPQRMRGASRGLSVVPVPQGLSGTAVIYAAQPGAAAQDGPPGGHGVFTGALLETLDSPGQKLEEVFKQTARLVQERTNGRQEPFLSLSVTGDFYFRPPAAVVSPPPGPLPPESGQVLLFWQAIADSRRPEDFELFLQQFGDSPLAPLAQARLAALATPPPPESRPGAEPAVGQYPRRQSPSAGSRFRDCPDCPEMVVVPSGTFTMGSPSSERGRTSDEGPQRQVRIGAPFAVGVHPVTVGEYGAFARATGGRGGPVTMTVGKNNMATVMVRRDGSGNDCFDVAGRTGPNPPRVNWHSPGFSQSSTNPVVCVSWNDAQAYVKWLSEKTGHRYRLLSEAEWEYAARAGTTTRYWWGDGIDRSKANYGGGERGTVPVGRYAANPFGLHDVHGNVWEWVEDCWNGSYSGAPSDGSAWLSGDCDRRVLRGGSWDNDPEWLRAAYRNRNGTGGRGNYVGIRVARTL